MSNFDHWNLAEHFYAYEAAALAVGKEPSEPDKGTAFQVVLAAIEQGYRDRLNQYHAAASWGAADGPGSFLDIPIIDKPREIESLSLSEAIKSALRRGVSQRWEQGFADLEDFDSQRFSRAELARWFSANGNGFVPKYDFAGNGLAQESAPQEKPLSTTERNTLLRIIAVLAVRGYGIDPKASRLEKIGEIRRDAEGLGLSISDDTLRAKLREAFAVIEG